MKQLIAIHRIERQPVNGRDAVIEPRQTFEATNEEAERLIALGSARDPNAPKKTSAAATRVNRVQAEKPAEPVQEKGAK